MRQSFSTIFVAIVVTSFCGISHAASDNPPTSLPLKDYNGWNLPFALNMTVAPASSETMEFPTDSYLMGCNPTAFFSIIFLESS